MSIPEWRAGLRANLNEGTTRALAAQFAGMLRDIHIVGRSGTRTRLACDNCAGWAGVAEGTDLAAVFAEGLKHAGECEGRK